MPLSIVFQFLITLGNYSLYFEGYGTKDHLRYVIQNNFVSVIVLTSLMLITQYICVYTVVYLINKNTIILNQL